LRLIFIFGKMSVEKVRKVIASANDCRANTLNAPARRPARAAESAAASSSTRCLAMTAAITTSVGSRAAFLLQAVQPAPL
jgi:hypothetical protein